MTCPFARVVRMGSIIFFFRDIRFVLVELSNLELCLLLWIMVEMGSLMCSLPLLLSQSTQFQHFITVRYFLLIPFQALEHTY